MHTINMEITWDSVKAKSNRLKHRIFFSDVEPVFYDPNAISFEDLESKGETRYIVIGLDSLGRLVVASLPRGCHPIDICAKSQQS